MANQTVAATWLLGKTDTLNVSFIEYDWGQPYFNDISVLIEVDGIVHKGRGTSKDGEVALEKACAEAIERYCCFLMALPTVGCAVHSVNEIGKLKSKEELIERDVFKKFLMGELSSEEFESDIHLDFFDDICSSSKFRFWKIVHNKKTVVFCITFSGQKPVSLGIAFGCNIASQEKAFLEALRNYVAFKKDDVTFKAMVRSNKNLWCCDSTVLDRLLERNSSPGLPSHISLSSGNIETTILKVSKIIDMADCPLYFCRSSFGASFE